MKNWLVTIEVMLHPAILDPQGKATLYGLKNLGFESIHTVRIGKRIELQITAATAADAETIGKEAATKLLANPVMETFMIQVHEMKVN